MRSESRGILSPVRLPIPPLQQRLLFYHGDNMSKSQEARARNLRRVRGQGGLAKLPVPVRLYPENAHLRHSYSNFLVEL
jgi:hypothetical protein